MSQELWCIVCDRFIQTDDLQLVRDGNHKTFYDRKLNVVHVCLNEKKSAKHRKEPPPEPPTTVRVPAPPAPTPVVPAPGPAEIRKQWKSEESYE